MQTENKIRRNRYILMRMIKLLMSIWDNFAYKTNLQL